MGSLLGPGNCSLAYLRNMSVKVCKMWLADQPGAVSPASSAPLDVWKFSLWGSGLLLLLFNQQDALAHPSPPG